MTEVLEFGTREDANTVRDDHDAHLTGRFDRRFAKIEIADAVPDDVEAEIRGIAADGRADRESGAGHLELTDAEKRRLGPFSGKNNYRKATAVKAAFLDAGIDDWSSHYDPELTVDEHTGRIEQVRQQQTGADVRDGPTEKERLQKEADAASRVEDEECGHAVDYCESGDWDACEFLVESCGLDRDEAERLTDVVDGTGNDPQELTGEAYGALSKLWDQYRTGLANAKDAAAGINEVRRQHGQDALAFEQLGDRTITAGNINA